MCWPWDPCSCWEQMLRPWQEGPLCELSRAWTGPAGMEGFLSAQVCGATREARAQGSQACLSLHPLPWPRASESWKEPWEGKVLLGRGWKGLLARVSLVAHTVLGQYLHALNTNTLFVPSLFAQTGLISLLDCIFTEDLCPNPLIFQR